MYPTSTTPVYVTPATPATLNGGAVVIQGQAPLVFGDGDTPHIVDYGLNAITAGAPVNVMVVDEFLG